MGIFLILFGVFVIAASARAMFLHYKVASAGVRCKAKVVGVQVVSSSRGSNGYALMVAFTYYNEDSRKEQRATARYASKAVTSQARANKQLGREFDVLYNAASPDFVTSANPRDNAWNYLQYVVIMLFCGILPVILRRVLSR